MDFAIIFAIVCFLIWFFTGAIHPLFLAIASLAIGKTLYENDKPIKKQQSNGQQTHIRNDNGRN